MYILSSHCMQVVPAWCLASVGPMDQSFIPKIMRSMSHQLFPRLLVFHSWEWVCPLRKIFSIRAVPSKTLLVFLSYLCLVLFIPFYLLLCLLCFTFLLFSLLIFSACFHMFSSISGTYRNHVTTAESPWGISCGAWQWMNTLDFFSSSFDEMHTSHTKFPLPDLFSPSPSFWCHFFFVCFHPSSGSVVGVHKFFLRFKLHATLYLIRNDLQWSIWEHVTIANSSVHKIYVYVCM